MSKPTNDNPSLKLSEGFLVYSGCTSVDIYVSED